MNTAKILGEDERYADEASLSVLERLPDSAWGCLVECCEEKTGLDQPGIDCRLVATSETLEDFVEAKKNHWCECGAVEEITTEAGTRALHFERVQTRKGEQRKDIVVADFGDTRVVLL